MPALSCSTGGRSLHNAPALCPSCLAKKIVQGQRNFAKDPDHMDALASCKAEAPAGQFCLQKWQSCMTLFLQMILVIRFRPASCNKVTTILVFVLQLKVVLFLLLELLSKSEVQTVIQQ